jgi:transketolase
MTVLSPSDPITTRKAVLTITEREGPAYMRLGRNVSQVLYDEKVDFQIGKMIRLREGGNLTIIATGNMVYQAMIAAEALAKRDIQARVLDCHTIKPIDKEAIIEAAKETGGIVTAEDHNIIGGLGSAVCEVLAESWPTHVRRVGLNDCFASSGRDYRKLLSHFRMDATAIQTAAEELFCLPGISSVSANRVTV